MALILLVPDSFASRSEVKMYMLTEKERSDFVNEGNQEKERLKSLNKFIGM